MSQSDNKEEKPMEDKTDSSPQTADGSVQQSAEETSASVEETKKKAPVEAPKEETPAEEQKTDSSVEQSAEKASDSVEETKKEAPVEAPSEAPKEEEEAPKKGDANQPKKTKLEKPTDCAACGKTLLKKMWYYRNSAYYCNKRCHKKKIEADAQKAAEEAKKDSE